MKNGLNERIFFLNQSNLLALSRESFINPGYFKRSPVGFILSPELFRMWHPLNAGSSVGRYVYDKVPIVY